MSKYRNDNIRNESCELYGAEGVTFFFFYIFTISKACALSMNSGNNGQEENIFEAREKKSEKNVLRCMRACFECRCERRKSRFVCMFKVSWKKKKRTAYLEYM